MLDIIINFLKNLSRKEKNQTQVEIVAVEEPKKERTYLDYDWTPVVEFETGGKSYYEKFLKKMSWPNGESGITMGIGADLGYMTKEEFEKFFSKYFTKEQCDRLKSVIGLKGENAKNALSKVKDIELSWDNAYKAFIEWTLPKFWKMTSDLWVGLDKLKEPAQIALVSIVFNRGSATKGPSRVEMVNIKPYVMCQNYNAIAKEIRSMKRLWQGKGLDGLIKRREEEAKMVEDCA
jgi:GH24 family phage-related lysozyme (muramidase)